MSLPNDFDQVLAMLDAFLEQYPDAENGPAEPVLSSFFMLDANLHWCIGLIDATLNGRTDNPDYQEMLIQQDWFLGHSANELKATRAFLVRLLEVPETLRNWFVDDDASASFVGIVPLPDVVASDVGEAEIDGTAE